MDINTKKVKKNAWRITKKRGKTALRIRVPGGHLDVRHFDLIKQIANIYGNGSSTSAAPSRSAAATQHQCRFALCKSACCISLVVAWHLRIFPSSSARSWHCSPTRVRTNHALTSGLGIFAAANMCKMATGIQASITASGAAGSYFLGVCRVK